MEESTSAELSRPTKGKGFSINSSTALSFAVESEIMHLSKKESESEPTTWSPSNTGIWDIPFQTFSL